MENILEVKNLNKIYQDFKLENINLTIPYGCIMGIIGENGAGKTTIIKSILNVINIDFGDVKIFGMDVKKNEKLIKKDIGTVLDDSFLSEYLTPKDVGIIMSKFYDTWNNSIYSDYLKKFNLPEDKFIKTFSSGMKMKIKIITALSHNPKLLILDEPTSGLDPVARNEILDILMEFIQDDKRSVLLSTHITSDLEHIADYITFVNKGNIVFTKTREETLDNFGILKCSEQDFKNIDKNDMIRFKKNKYDYEILVENKNKCRTKYPNNIIDKPTIEDIMLLYIRGEKV